MKTYRILYLDRSGFVHSKDCVGCGKVEVKRAIRREVKNIFKIIDTECVDRFGK